MNDKKETSNLSDDRGNKYLVIAPELSKSPDFLATCVF